jgi:uncharacterized cupin superfamily protein
MSKLDLKTIPARSGSSYPSPFDREVASRVRQRLGDAGGLTQFGVNLLQLPPGTMSSHRHWHSKEDEFMYVLSGEVTLVTDAGEEILRTGDCAAFPANRANGHQLVNRGAVPATCLEVGSRDDADRVVYPDIDLLYDPEQNCFTHRDGAPYPPRD